MILKILPLLWGELKESLKIYKENVCNYVWKCICVDFMEICFYPGFYSSLIWEMGPNNTNFQTKHNFLIGKWPHSAPCHHSGFSNCLHNNKLARAKCVCCPWALLAEQSGCFWWRFSLSVLSSDRVTKVLGFHPQKHSGTRTMLF